MASPSTAQVAIVFWWAVYFLSLLFTNVLDLPVVGQKVQLPELVFLLGLPIWWFSKPDIFQNKLDKLLLALPAVMLVAACFSPGRSSLLEVLGLVYLYGVYLLTRQAVFTIDVKWLRILVRMVYTLVIALSIISGVTGIMGLYPSEALSEQKWVPFIGIVPRINGTSISPNLWCSLLAFISILYFRVNNGERFYRLMLFLGGLCLFMTGSKSLLALLAVCLMFSKVNNASLRWIGGGVVLIYWLMVHWLIVPQRVAVSYLPEQSCTNMGTVELCYTTYWLLKQHAVEALVSSKGLGVGGGQFSTYLDEQQAMGAYPADLTAREPHSSYFGLLAEAGVFGGAAVVLLVLGVLKLAKYSKKSPLQQAALMYLSLLAIDAMVMDVLNFRMLWVALGVVASYYESESSYLSRSINR